MKQFRNLIDATKNANQIDYIPILAGFEEQKKYEESVRAGEVDRSLAVPPLSMVLRDKLNDYNESKKTFEGDLPVILFYHAHTKQVFTFPKKLSDALAWSTGLV